MVALIAAGLYAFNASNTTSQETGNQTTGSSTPINSGYGGNPAGTVETGQTEGQQCAAQGGTWSEQYKECTGVNEGSCREIGGDWNECASACRHNPDAQVCVMMCVAVCSFTK